MKKNKKHSSWVEEKIITILQSSYKPQLYVNKL